uniref:Kringle domain-containing protein n=1 Tax=Macrostomum lignano TaxID=282301 RepID=A0A1I8FQV9_9PLAT
PLMPGRPVLAAAAASYWGSARRHPGGAPLRWRCKPRRAPPNGEAHFFDRFPDEGRRHRRRGLRPSSNRLRMPLSLAGQIESRRRGRWSSTVERLSSGPANGRKDGRAADQLEKNAGPALPPAASLPLRNGRFLARFPLEMFHMVDGDKLAQGGRNRRDAPLRGRAGPGALAAAGHGSTITPTRRLLLHSREERRNAKPEAASVGAAGGGPKGVGIPPLKNVVRATAAGRVSSAATRVGFERLLVDKISLAAVNEYLESKGQLPPLLVPSWPYSTEQPPFSWKRIVPSWTGNRTPGSPFLVAVMKLDHVLDASDTGFRAMLARPAAAQQSSSAGRWTNIFGRTVEKVVALLSVAMTTVQEAAISVLRAAAARSAQSSFCSQGWRDDSFCFTSPFYRHKYPNNTDCIKVIQ